MSGVTRVKAGDTMSGGKGTDTSELRSEAVGSEGTLVSDSDSRYARVQVVEPATMSSRPAFSEPVAGSTSRFHA